MNRLIKPNISRKMAPRGCPNGKKSSQLSPKKHQQQRKFLSSPERYVRSTKLSEPLLVAH